jgi:MFS family permease
MGIISDHTRTRTSPFIGGVICLFAATLMLHLGRTFVVLMLARVFQGLSGAVVWVAGLALLADTCGKNEIGRAMGYVFMAMSLGLLLGPLLGGILFEKVGYNSVFVLAYVFLAFDILLRVLIIDKKQAQQWLESGRTESEVERNIPLTELGETQDPPVVQIRSRIPSILLMLKSRRLLASLWGTTVIAILMTSLDAILTIYVERTFNWTSLGAGKKSSH